MFNSNHDTNDDTDELYSTSGLFGDAATSTGTKFTRQRGNGRLTSPDADTETDPPGVDRSPKGRFVSRERDPEPIRRNEETGRLYRDRYAVGEFYDEDDERDAGWL